MPQGADAVRVNPGRIFEIHRIGNLRGVDTAAAGQFIADPGVDDNMFNIGQMGLKSPMKVNLAAV